MQPQVDLSIVVAMTRFTGLIGIGGGLPWNIPSDLANFMKITLEVGVMIMGHKTYASILARNGDLLPRRHHIVLSRTCEFQPDPFLTTVHSVEEALAEVASRGGRACVVGGAEVYRSFEPLATRAYVTWVFPSMYVDGDAFYPNHDMVGWQELDPEASKLTPASLAAPNDDHWTSHRIYVRPS